LEDVEEFVKPEGFTPILQYKGIQDTFLPVTNILVRAEESVFCVLQNVQHRLQISNRFMGKEKLHVSDG
jgi:hypothetical protein